MTAAALTRWRCAADPRDPRRRREARLEAAERDAATELCAMRREEDRVERLGTLCERLRVRCAEVLLIEAWARACSGVTRTALAEVKRNAVSKIAIKAVRTIRGARKIESITSVRRSGIHFECLCRFGFV